MLGVLHMALLNELFGRKFKLTILCVCSFQTFGAVLMIQRWRTNSKAKGQASLFSASLFEGIHSVHRDANSH